LTIKENTMATSSADSRSAKLKTSFQKLSLASHTLNTASDTFGESITVLDEALNILNPGVTAWVTVSRSTSQVRPWEASEERLGYTKINRWGLCICTVDIDERPDGGEETQDVWLFNDAPRQIRLRAIEHVPELIEVLANEALRTATRVREQAELAVELAKSIGEDPNAKGNR
jgi:hypothetical protein